MASLGCVERARPKPELGRGHGDRDVTNRPARRTQHRPVHVMGPNESNESWSMPGNCSRLLPLAFISMLARYILVLLLV
jgi:hypothetical protein